MVEKMTKFSFILLDEETEGFLQHLQGLGVVDITRSRKPVDDRSASMLEKASAEKRALTTLKRSTIRMTRTRLRFWRRQRLRNATGIFPS